MPPPVRALWGAQRLRPSLSKGPALAQGSWGKAASPGANPRARPPLPSLHAQPCGSPGAAPHLLAPQLWGHLSLCKRRGSLPARGQAAKFQPRAHFYGVTPVGPRQETARDPGVRLRDSGTGATAACVDGSTGTACPAVFLPLPVEALAKYYKTSSFLSPRVQTPRCCLALPTPAIPFLPPGSFSRQLLTQAAFGGAPGQVAERAGARDKSAAGKVGRRGEPRAGTLAGREGGGEQGARSPRPRRGAEPLSSSHQPPLRWQTLTTPSSRTPSSPLCPAAELGLAALSRGRAGPRHLPAGRAAWARRAPRQRLRAGLRRRLPPRSVLWLCLRC